MWAIWNTIPHSEQCKRGMHFLSHFTMIELDCHLFSSWTPLQHLVQPQLTNVLS